MRQSVEEILPVGLMPFAEMHNCQSKTSKQRQEEGLSAVNKACVQAAK